jgi:hypothetical protein
MAVISIIAEIVMLKIFDLAEYVTQEGGGGGAHVVARIASTVKSGICSKMEF